MKLCTTFRHNKKAYITKKEATGGGLPLSLQTFSFAARLLAASALDLGAPRRFVSAL